MVLQKSAFSCRKKLCIILSPFQSKYDQRGMTVFTCFLLTSSMFTLETSEDQFYKSWQWKQTIQSDFCQSSMCSLVACLQIYSTQLSEKEKKRGTAESSSADFSLHFHCLHYDLKLKICKSHYNKKQQSYNLEKQVNNVREQYKDVLLHSES